MAASTAAPQLMTQLPPAAAPQPGRVWWVQTFPLVTSVTKSMNPQQIRHALLVCAIYLVEWKWNTSEPSHVSNMMRVRAENGIENRGIVLPESNNKPLSRLIFHFKIKSRTRDKSNVFDWQHKKKQELTQPETGWELDHYNTVALLRMVIVCFLSPF